MNGCVVGEAITITMRDEREDYKLTRVASIFTECMRNSKYHATFSMSPITREGTL